MTELEVKELQFAYQSSRHLCTTCGKISDEGREHFYSCPKFKKVFKK